MLSATTSHDPHNVSNLRDVGYPGMGCGSCRTNSSPVAPVAARFIAGPTMPKVSTVRQQRRLEKCNAKVDAVVRERDSSAETSEGSPP